MKTLPYIFLGTVQWVVVNLFLTPDSFSDLLKQGSGFVRECLLLAIDVEPLRNEIKELKMIRKPTVKYTRICSTLTVELGSRPFIR